MSVIRRFVLQDLVLQIPPLSPLASKGAAFSTFSNRALSSITMAKRKRLSEAQALQSTQTPIPVPPLRQPRRSSQRAISTVTSDPALGNDVFDGIEALRASPSALPDDPIFGLPDSSVGAQKKKAKAAAPRRADAPSNIELEVLEPAENAVQPSSTRSSKDQIVDPEGDEIPVEDVGAVMAAASRPPPVDSDYLPLPWKGRLGYVCSSWKCT